MQTVVARLSERFVEPDAAAQRLQIMIEMDELARTAVVTTATAVDTLRELRGT